MKKYYLYLIVYFFLFIASIFPFFYTHTDAYEKKLYKYTELYEPELGRITSVNEAILYIDSTHRNDNTFSPIFDTLNYVKKTSHFVKARFHHDLANYSAQENWIANLCGKLFWSHFSAVVIPDDILKHSKGICSQQAMVYMEILKQKGVTTRKIGWGDGKPPGHFLTEVYYNNSWHLYDINKEPEWKKISHHYESMEFYMKNQDTLYLAYQNRLSRAHFDKLMEKVEYGKPNEFSAPHMLWFHRITKWVTYILPLFFFMMSILSFFKLRSTTSVLKKYKEEILVTENSTSSTTT